MYDQTYHDQNHMTYSRLMYDQTYHDQNHMTYSGSMYDQTYHDQNHMTYGSGNNRDFNIYNPEWGAHPEFSWQPYPVVTPVIHGSQFKDASYYDQPYSQYQSSPITYSPSFEEKVLQALDRIEHIGQSLTPQSDQLMLAQQKSLDELMDQTDQLLFALNKEEEGDLPS